MALAVCAVVAIAAGELTSPSQGLSGTARPLGLTWGVGHGYNFEVPGLTSSRNELGGRVASVVAALAVGLV